MPSSYDSRDLDVALGFDLTGNSRLELTYIRQDQADVEFPGLVFDIQALQTDGFELKYIAVDQPFCDLITMEGWYNETRFNGDTRGAGKNRQIPSLVSTLQPAGLFAPGVAVTDVDSMSTGARVAASWGEEDYAQVTLGSDVIIVNQQLNDTEDPLGVGAFFPTPFNLPIPRSTQNDVGIFLDTELLLTSRLKVNAGTRVDFVDSDARNSVPNLHDLFDIFGGTGCINRIAQESDLLESVNMKKGRIFV